MKKLAKSVRKIIVGIVGFPLLALGIVLIPLPGPGVVVSAMAFFILSLEFDWAEKYLNRLVGILKGIWQRSQERAARFEEKHTQEKDKKQK